MSLKPPKKSDLDKNWMKARLDRPKKIQPEYHLIVTEGTETEPAYFGAIRDIINNCILFINYSLFKCTQYSYLSAMILVILHSKAMSFRYPIRLLYNRGSPMGTRRICESRKSALIAVI